MSVPADAIRQLDLRRRAALRVRLTLAFSFRSRDIPIASEEDVFSQRSITQNLEAISQYLLAHAKPPLDEAIHTAIADFKSIPIENPILAQRTKTVIDELNAFTCADCLGAKQCGFPCNGDKSQDLSIINKGSACLKELFELFNCALSIVDQQYRKFTILNSIFGRPEMYLETSNQHADRCADIFQITAATGSCRVRDNGLNAIIILGIKDDSLDWITLCQLPYLFVHELLCHAYQGVLGAHRTCADATCSWSEGWMDAIALEVTQQWLRRGGKSTLPDWLDEAREASIRVSNILHDYRLRPQDYLLPEALHERLAAHEAALTLGRKLKGKNRSNKRLLQFSLALNLHQMSQEERTHIVTLIYECISMFIGVRLDLALSACVDFTTHNDPALFVQQLERLKPLALAHSRGH
jgi:hypothetical protein